MSTRSSSGGFEQGLLGLVFDPNYENNGRFYINYTDLNGDTRIARYLVSGNPNVANPTADAMIMTEDQPYANHNGGDMHFGPDGYLYIGLGDGGSGGDPENRAQNINERLGEDAAHRCERPGRLHEPADEPVLWRHPGRDEIWAIGLRNPWRFSFDRLTGDLFIADVGQGAREEVNFVPSTSAGLNYGWRLMEGSLCYNPPANCNPGGLTLPILDYGHTGGNCSITGGYRYRGASTALYGRYIYGDYCTGRIWTATQSGANWTAAEAIDSTLNITSFGEDEDGEVYVADQGGAIYRITAPDTDGDTVADIADNCPLVVNPLQQNDDANFIEMSPQPYDDLTLANSDGLGNACDDNDDNDGLLDAQEGVFPAPACPSASAMTSPTLRDSDGDRALDGAECARNTDPSNPASAPTIAQCGANTDATTTAYGCFGVSYYNTNPSLADTDLDGIADGCEVASINADTVVNVIDLQQIAAHFTPLPYGQPGPPHLINFDVTKDGAVNVIDLQQTAARFPTCM